MILNGKNTQTQTDLDLLQVLFEDEETYPWNPTEPESEAYLTELEAELSLSECFTETEMSQRSQTFFHQVEQLYTTTTLQYSLRQRFAERVPRDLLQHLADAALQVSQKMSDCSGSLADQLVACVQETLPQWQTEDLYVLARPFAYSMLGSEMEIQTTEWTELSEVEQARISLAIAHYALSELIPSP